MRQLFVSVMFILILIKGSAQLVINEVCSYNELVADSYGEFNDWIELKNIGDSPINTLNYFLSDEEINIFKWQLPNYVLYPNEVVVFFSETSYDDEVHFNFGISNDGETLYLSQNPMGLEQELEVPLLRVNDSYGRSIVDESYVFYDTITPNEENSSDDKIGYSDLPSASIEAGFYEGSQIISFDDTCPSGSVYFSIDGSFPTEDSPIYTEALSINSITTLKSICIEEDHLPSATLTDTYIINSPYSLPIVALSVDHDSLFDPEVGLYMPGPDALPEWPHFGANYWKDEHIKTSFEYFEDEQRQVSQEVDLKIHGGKSSRNKAQRPLRITARSKYGNEFIHFPFFEEKPELEDFQHLILRNSGSDFLKSNFRDGFWHQISLFESLDFDVFGFQPCIVLINGEYWGIMNLREKVSENYIAEAHEISPDSILIMEKENYSFKGDTIHFFNFKEFAINEDLSLTDNYNVVQDQLDIDSYIDYFSTEIYAGNLDWPANNIKYWKESPTQGKWKYIMFDLDTTMELYEYIPYDLDMFQFMFEDKAWAINSKLFISLLDNQEFKRRFINRMCDLMNTSFSEETLSGHLETIEDEFSPEINQHFNRWYGDLSRYERETTDVIPTFFNVRGGFVKEHLMEHFFLENVVHLEFDTYPSNSGKITVNTISPELPFTGDYFNGNSIDVSIEPFEGRKFLRWDYSEGVFSDDNQNSIQNNFKKSGKLVAIFEDNNSGDFFILNNFNSNSVHSAIFNSPQSNTAEITVYSTRGEMVLSKSEAVNTGKNVVTFTSGNLDSGIYLVELLLGNDRYVDKLFIP